MDMHSVVYKLFEPILNFIYGIAFSILNMILISILVFLLGFFIFNPIRPWHLKNTSYLKALNIRFKAYNLIRWLIIDMNERASKPIYFNEYGFTIYVGRQGAGKTMAMIEYLHRIHKKHPNCLIVTNFDCSIATHIMKDWHDFMEIRNGTDGVIFAIDEIHSEYSSESWKDFPESLLSEISQQRKQRIKIVATSQVFGRVAKPIREQAFSVVACATYLKRFTTTKEYDSAEYSTSDNPYMIKKKVKPIGKYSFVQSDEIRSSYDTYAKIERMRKIEFISRSSK